MSIAPLQAIVEADTLEKSMIEYELSVNTSRRMLLSRKSGEAAEDYSEKLAHWNNYENKKKAGEETTAEEDALWGSFDWDVFAAQNETLNRDIQYQDKALQMASENLQTKLSAVTTRLEGNEKQLKQNIEKECNYAK